jgi:transposase-like protein
VITTFCPICFSSSNERASIDATIKANRESFDSIARRLGVSRRVVQRHRDHLSEAPKSEPTTVVIAPVYNINLVVSPTSEDRRVGGEHDPAHLEEEQGEGVRS